MTNQSVYLYNQNCQVINERSCLPSMIAGNDTLLCTLISGELKVNIGNIVCTYYYGCSEMFFKSTSLTLICTSHSPKFFLG